MSKTTGLFSGDLEMYKTRCARTTGAGWVRVTKPQPAPVPAGARGANPHGFTNP